MSEAGPSLVWFRDDLRTADNPALTAAIGRGRPAIALYVLDEDSDGIRPLGGAARWWLHHSLARLGERLQTLGIPLVLRRGAASAVLRDVAGETGAGAIFWNRRYGGPEVAVDAAVKAALARRSLSVQSFQANLLHEPWTLKPASAPFYRVYTPFWKAARAAAEPRRPLPAPEPVSPAATAPRSDALDDWRLLPTMPDWSAGLAETWEPGETSAHARLARFVDGSLAGYAAGRDRPDIEATSRLSPHLRFGEISPFQVWHAVRSRTDGASAEKFLSEIGWREFCWHLLFHNPDLATRNFDTRFDTFPWRDDAEGLSFWRKGRTGYPIVDAGMRQLWRTGWMHNRMRMVTASFLVKDLLVDWRHGEAWFWDTLVDADAANNPANWQWVAGCGADAAPFFRVFNPGLQAEKFDPDGAYVRRWVRELGGLPADRVHLPGQVAGGSYPAPVVDHATARRRALDAFATIR